MTPERDLDFVRDLASDLVLKDQHAGQPAVVLLGPHVQFVADTYQLGRNPDGIGIFPDAPLQDILDIQLQADLLEAFLAVLVVHHGGARDDAQAIRIQAPKLRDHLFGEPVAPVILAGIAREILDRQHRQHQRVARRVRANLHAGPLPVPAERRQEKHRCGSGLRPKPPGQPPGREGGSGPALLELRNRSLRRQARRSRRSRFPRFHRDDEAVPQFRERLDISRLSRGIGQPAAQFPDRGVQAALEVDVGFGRPEDLPQLAAADHVPGAFDQYLQHAEWLWSKPQSAAQLV